MIKTSPHMPRLMSSELQLSVRASNSNSIQAKSDATFDSVSQFVALRSFPNMSHCHDEHHHHGHDHSEGAAHDHTDDITPALQNHVYEPIDFSAITTLNEAEPQSGAKIVQKTWMERMDQEPELNSDADEQLLMHIPYVSQPFRPNPSQLTAPKASQAKSDSTASCSALPRPPTHP